MKRTRRIAFLLVTVLVMSLMSISAFAKGGKVNVPTAGEYYRWDYDYTEDPATGKWVPTSGKYVKDGSFTATYDKNGKIKSFTKFDEFGNVQSRKTFKWKKDYLVKVAATMYSYNYTDYKYDEKYENVIGATATIKSTATSSDKNKFKKNRLSKNTYSYVRTYVNGSAPDYSNSSTKYSYLKNTAVGKTTDKVNGSKYYDVFEVTKKGQRKEEGSTKYEYAKNGNIKKVTTKRKGTQASFNETTKYDKYGYPRSIVGSSSSIDEGVPYSSSWNRTYTYIMGAKHCPSIIEWVDNTSNSKDGSDTTPSKYKLAVTGTKTVAQVRNCDAFGTGVGIVSEYSLDDGWFTE